MTRATGLLGVPLLPFLRVAFVHPMLEVRSCGCFRECSKSRVGTYIAVLGSVRGKDHTRHKHLATHDLWNSIMLGLRNQNVGSLCLCGFPGP